MNGEVMHSNETHNFGVWLIDEYGVSYLHELYINLAQIKDFEAFSSLYEKREDDERIICNAFYVVLRFRSIYRFYEEYREMYGQKIMPFGTAMKLIVLTVQSDKRLSGIFNDRLVFRNSFYEEIEEFYEYMYKAEHTFVPGE